ncbi:Phosphatidylinositol 4-kinase alpha 1 [Ancistrocladus abbreviatus]
MIRRKDLKEHGPSLKARVNAKLSAYRAAAILKIKSVASLGTEGNTAKRLLRDTLALLIVAAEACLLSSWRKLRICEELFSCLLSGVSLIAATRGGRYLEQQSGSHV